MTSDESPKPHEGLIERIEHAVHEREERVEREIESEAAVSPDDPITAREELEQELMDEHISEAGEEIGGPSGQ
jgi:hypothetical protein